MFPGGGSRNRDTRILRVRQVGHQLTGDLEEALDGAEIVQGLDHLPYAVWLNLDLYPDAPTQGPADGRS